MKSQSVTLKKTLKVGDKLVVSWQKNLGGNLRGTCGVLAGYLRGTCGVASDLCGFMSALRVDCGIKSCNKCNNRVKNK